MSRTPGQFAPDPTKWIDTSKSSSKPKQKPQRPLVGFNNNLNISTPPPSTFRRSTHNSVYKDETPIHKQVGLKGYLTPPTTGPSTSKPKHPRERLERLRMEVEKELGTPLGKAKLAQAKKKVDEFWGSSSSEHHPGSSRSREEEKGTKKGEVHIDPEDEDDIEGDLPVKRTPCVVGRSPRRPIPVNPISSQHPIRSSHLPSQYNSPARNRRRSRSPRTSPTPEHPPSSSTIARTPIPQHVLDVHARLCGQPVETTEKFKSPSRSRKRPQSPVPMVKSPRRDIENRVLTTHSKKQGKVETHPHLVDLSDEDSDSKGGNKRKRREETGDGVLKSLKVNARGKEFVTGFTSPRRKLRPTASGDLSTASQHVEQARAVPGRQPSRTASKLHLNDSPSSKTARSRRQPSIDHSEESPSPRKRARPRSKTLSNPNDPPTTSPPRPVTPHAETPLTPPRAHEEISPHHHIVTPPKEKSPKKLQDHNETLFAFPPPQPRFGSPVKPRVRADDKKEWKPVNMDAETLMTWSLGGPRSAPSKRPLPAAEDEMAVIAEERTPSQNRPHPTPLQSDKRRRSRSDSSDTESLAASQAGQSFPNFVHSSPTKTKSRLLEGSALAVDQVQEIEAAEEIRMPPSRQPSRSISTRSTLPPSSPPKVDQMLAAEQEEEVTPRPSEKSAADRWKRLERGILSVPPPQPAKSPASQSKGSQNKKRKSQGSSQKGQTKLAAFGFFPDETEPMSGSLRETFDKDWKEEPDLEFEHDRDHAAQDHSNSVDPLVEEGNKEARSRQGGEKRMRPVPDAPWHPDLRPAGIAELKRRERRRNDLEAERSSSLTPLEDDEGLMPPSHPGISRPTDSSSSLMSSDPLFPEDDQGGEARDWFARIGDRRSSEFGSFRSD